MKLSVIITTYNSEEWLHKVLFGFSIQTENDFEIVIADDGSTSKTQDVIAAFQDKFKYQILHVWHEDNPAGVVDRHSDAPARTSGPVDRVRASEWDRAALEQVSCRYLASPLPASSSAASSSLRIPP